MSEGSLTSEAWLATRGSGVRLLAELGGRVFTLASSLLLAAGLGVEGFGIFAAVSSVAVILAELGELGLQQTASRALVAGTFSLAAMLRARALLFGLLLLLAGSPPVLVSLGSVVPGLGAAAPLSTTPPWSVLLPPFILYFGLGGWSEFLGVALRARGRRVSEALVLLSLRAAMLAAVVVALAGGASLTGLGWALVASTVPPLLLAAWLTWRSPLPAEPFDPGDEIARPPQTVRAVLRASLPLAVNGALALMAVRVELLAVYAFRGSHEAGLFGAALKIVESLNGIPAAIAAGAMPALTREGLRAAGARGSAVRARTAATTALLAVPAAAGLCLLAPGLLRLLGVGYVAAAPALRVLAFACIGLFMNCVLLHALIAVGRAAWLPRLTAVRVAWAAVLALALVPRWGALAAAIGFLSAEALLLVLGARACAATGFAVRLARPLSLAAAASLPMALAVRLFAGGTLTAAALGVVVYGATLVVGWQLGRGALLRLLGADEARA